MVAAEAVIPQVKEGLLDLHDFNGDAEIAVEPWPGISVGQRYWLRAYGTDKEGGAHTVELAVAEAVTSEEVAAGLKVFLPRSDLLLLRNYSEMKVELKAALNGGDQESAASRFPMLSVPVRSEHKVITEKFDNHADQRINYGESFDIDTMIITVLDVQGHVNMGVGRLGAYNSARLDLKFSCRYVGFRGYKYSHATGFAFYSAQGTEIGRVMLSGQSGYQYLEFKAPNGLLVSRIETVSAGLTWIENMVFEL